MLGTVSIDLRMTIGLLQNAIDTSDWFIAKISAGDPSSKHHPDMSRPLYEVFEDLQQLHWISKGGGPRKMREPDVFFG